MQLVLGSYLLPGPKQQLAVSKWLNGRRHIYFAEQELNFIELKNKHPQRKAIRFVNQQKIFPGEGESVISR